jgi:hypothetical protein
VKWPESGRWNVIEKAKTKKIVRAAMYIIYNVRL